MRKTLQRYAPTFSVPIQPFIVKGRPRTEIMVRTLWHEEVSQSVQSPDPLRYWSRAKMSFGRASRRTILTREWPSLNSRRQMAISTRTFWFRTRLFADEVREPSSASTMITPTELKVEVIKVIFVADAHHLPLTDTIVGHFSWPRWPTWYSRSSGVERQRPPTPLTWLTSRP